MWINEVMASMEESYGLNLEWISGEGISEEICGVDKDCIVVPSSPGYHKVEIADVGHFQDNNEYIEIQVTEEEVVTDEWQVSNNGVDEDIGFSVESCDVNDGIPLLEDQDEFSRLHPYPCDFCSRRFSKKSSLSTHLLTHQLEDAHRCNMCGAQYKRKLDLVDHMKLHSYAPVNQTITEDEYETMPHSVLNKVKKKTKKKNGGKWQTHVIDPISPATDTKSVMNSIFNLNSLPSGTNLRKFEDIIIKTDSPSDEEFLLCTEDDKFPVIDPSRPYVCQHCGVGFAREKALMSHTMVHEGDSAYECDKCHEMFHTDHQLKQHQMKKHSKCFNSVKKGNNEDKFKTFQCDQCDASFIWYNQLKRHQRNHHMKEEDSFDEKYYCHPCNISFKTEGSFLMHKELHDNTSDSHSCNTCGEEFLQLSDLHSHMKSKHKWGHICHVCSSAYRDAKSLAKHLLVHTDVPRTYPCPTCQRLFYNRGKLKKHMQAAHEGGGSAVCSECGECFSDAASLATHRQSAHGSGRLFPCTQCGKTFTSRSSQQIHVRVHTGEKPYGCRFCWKAFADGGTLRKHERIHTGEKPYVCPVCTKAFNQRVVLREHVRAHHSGAGGRGRNYECIVCGETFGESLELCAHLVMHSDENTAKHRLPNTSTRKYNRRRKQTPTRSSEDSDSAYECQYTKKKVKVISPPIQSTGFSADEIENVEEKSDLGRARIVRSGKRLPKGQNRRFAKGRGKAAARLMSASSYASKYVVSLPEVKEEEDDDDSMRPRPRTKNVNFHSVVVEPKYEVATFPESSVVKKQPRRSSKKNQVSQFTIKKELIDPMDNQYINGIDPNIFEVGQEVEPIETCIVDDIGVELKLEVRTSEGEDLSVPTNTETINPDIKIETDEMVSCEICSEMFTARSDLLKHIEVHI